MSRLADCRRKIFHHHDRPLRCCRWQKPEEPGDRTANQAYDFVWPASKRLCGDRIATPQTTQQSPAKHARFSRQALADYSLLPVIPTLNMLFLSPKALPRQNNLFFRCQKQRNKRIKQPVNNSPVMWHSLGSVYPPNVVEFIFEFVCQNKVERSRTLCWQWCFLGHSAS